MSKSKIEWTEETWNPIAGCTRASAGCDNCYAAEMSLRLEAMALAKQAAGGIVPPSMSKYMGVSTRLTNGTAAFNGTIALDHTAVDAPRKWRKAKMVFVNSMADTFHRDVPFAFVHKLFVTMSECPQHTFQVLTKRAARMLAYQREYWPEGFPANVWAMTSVEHQEAADVRIPLLVQVKAAVRGLSMEPLLGGIDLSPYLLPEFCWHCKEKIGNEGGRCFCGVGIKPLIHWVIVGGESGRRARPMNPDWVRDIRDQCVSAGVSYFFKQWGEWVPLDQLEFHESLDFDTKEAVFETGMRSLVTVNRVGKKAAGRLLDGREWSEMPQAKEIEA